ncbi:MAG: phenylacetate--CoA ligase [Bacillota bacterium]|jgi:phenylacetate-CoA ligase
MLNKLSIAQDNLEREAGDGPGTKVKRQRLLELVYTASPFYHQKLSRAGWGPGTVVSDIQFAQLPFTTKEELRDLYPLGLQAVPDREVVRIHSSSGTTGKPVIIPYTQNDVTQWAEMFVRCYAMAGVTELDRIQITPGYGLWTAGIGFQAGAERLGAMAIPMGPGNTEKQLQMMVDLQSTVLCSTSSYALLLTEEIQKRQIRDQIKLRIGIIGSERWGDKMRSRIETELGIESFDIYGLTEIYGPGIGIDCPYHQGMHYWSDILFFEIINPLTGAVLPEGELGELVITTLTKEGAPLVRYRTHDLTRLIPGVCPCGSPYPRIDRILGRSDDMIKIKGVNVYPGQIEDILKESPGASSEYQIRLTHSEGRDRMLLTVEAENGVDLGTLPGTIGAQFKHKIGVSIEVQAVSVGTLPRSEKKSKRVFDERDL